ncbi:methyltransferase N6AMT1 [Chelonus insularis]|uniref:methyltransferase N6AMT1 n=1 Tax=Chelonus insularis TaxID=460826 RepID=UPI00158CA60B|nr:methyltransferase N6AMT1 [Chelonus insularis]
METPIVKLTKDDLEKVYEPSEDSFLLIDSLEADLNNLKALKPMMCMEIGSGSGIVITALALASQKEWFSHFIAIDVNPDACRVTKNTSVINRTSIDIIQMDLTSAFQSRHIFDLIIFNPPYVITETIEIEDKNLITKSWAGGKNGREVMDRVIPLIPELLSKNGIFYLVAIKENNIENIIKILEHLNMTGKVIGERKVRGEHLYVIKFVKK